MSKSRRLLEKKAREMGLTKIPRDGSLQTQPRRMLRKLSKVDKVLEKKRQAADNVIKQDFLAYYKKFDCHFSKAARLTGVSKATIYRMLEADEEFNKSMTEIEEDQIDDIEVKALKNAKNSNKAVAERIFILKTRRRSKYGDGDKEQDGQKIIFNYGSISMMRGGANNENSGQDNQHRVPSVTPAIEVSPEPSEV